MNRERIREYVHQYTYYFIIGISSLFALVFLPMVGSEIGLGFDVPDTVSGWIVWIASKCIVSSLNVLIFHSFKQQAKINVKNDKNYTEANAILNRSKPKEYHPRSPKTYQTKAYAKKGTTIFITSGLATIALTQAILRFDAMTMLTYLFTIIMGVIFGIMTMFKDEEYWTTEYLDYAKYMEETKYDRNKQ